jgi:hypothetical protein
MRAIIRNIGINGLIDPYTPVDIVLRHIEAALVVVTEKERESRGMLQSLTICNVFI